MTYDPKENFSMRNWLSRRPSPAMAVAFIALLAALSGTAVALPGKNAVDTGDIKNGQVKGRDIANNAVTGGKIKDGAVGGADVTDNSLTGADVNEGSLGQVPSAANAATANTANSANTANTAGNANTLDGKNSTEFLPAGGDAPSGSILRGVLNIGAGYDDPTTPSPAGTRGTGDSSVGVRFATQPGFHYVEAGQSGPPACNSGTAGAPDAAPGSVCVYEVDAKNEVSIGANPPTRQGATLFIRAEAPGEAYVIATWAARAP